MTVTASEVHSPRPRTVAPPNGRALHVYSGNLYGGIETFLRTVAGYQAQTTATADFALCFDGQLANELRDAGATVHLLGAVRARSPRSILDARRSLAQVLDRGGYNVVVCHSAWPHAFFASVVRKHGARLVFYLHDVPNRRGWPDHVANRTRPDLVICNSRFTAASAPWFFQGIPRRVLRYPVELNRSQGHASRTQVRASLETAEDAIVILQASRMQAWKGHRLLIAALAELRAVPGWVCWIAGGAQRAEERAYERELRADVVRFGLEGRVKFLGHRSDVPALMRAADVFCQPNLGPEPFGIVFVEALAAGLPAVTTAMGGPTEIVDESCGRLVPLDSSALATALAGLITSDMSRADLSRGGPARARELCDPRRCTAALAAELESLQSFVHEAGSRAALSAGRSEDAILETVAQALRERGERHEVVVDLGCGRGDCGRRLDGTFGTYIGCDVVRYANFPEVPSISFRQVDLNQPPYPLAEASADVVVSIETIEHVENPRALVREMVRIVKPGGWILVTTPNQLSLASKLNLLVRNEFQAFQEAPGLYPAHITALVEADLRRIARECGLVEVDVRYTDKGRIPFTGLHWPRKAGLNGRSFSDGVMLVARRR
jgi:glycosyltransferase involved in cell wall biosynthesis/SAM-dependent methyltransferase